MDTSPTKHQCKGDPSLGCDAKQVTKYRIRGGGSPHFARRPQFGGDFAARVVRLLPVIPLLGRISGS